MTVAVPALRGLTWIFTTILLAEVTGRSRPTSTLVGRHRTYGATGPGSLMCADLVSGPRWKDARRVRGRWRVAVRQPALSGCVLTVEARREEKLLAVGPDVVAGVQRLHTPDLHAGG